MSCVEQVVIAGGGIGGLSLALALKQRGIGVVVLEKASGLSEVGAGITLWRNALAPLEKLGLNAALDATGEQPPQGAIGLANGKLLAHMAPEQLPDSIPRPLMLAFHRQDLQRLLFEALPEGTVRFDTSVTHATQTDQIATLHTTSGQSYLADLIVGCDGIASPLRTQIKGKEPPRYAGYTCFRGVTRQPDDLQHFGEFWGVGSRIGVVPIGKGRVYWFAVADAPPQHPVENPHQELTRYFGEYSMGLPALLGSTPKEAILHNDIIDRPPVNDWSQGRITLLGDAIHPTTPNMGQGAAMAIESAWVLAKLLAERKHLPDALREYEAARAPRTRWVTESSLRLGKLAHIKNPLGRRLRNWAVGVTPASVQLASLKKLLSVDVTRT